MKKKKKNKEFSSFSDGGGYSTQPAAFVPFGWGWAN